MSQSCWSPFFLMLLGVGMVLLPGCGDSPDWTYRLPQGEIATDFTIAGQRLLFARKETRSLSQADIYLRQEQSGSFVSTEQIYTLMAVDLQDRQLKWQFRPQGSLSRQAPFLLGDRLYFGTIAYHDKTFFYALDAHTGREIWKFPALPFLEFAPISLENGIAFVDLEGGLYALERKTGQLRWQFKPAGSVTDHSTRQNIPNQVTTQPIATKERLYVQARDGLYSLDTKTGKPQWRFRASGKVPRYLGPGGDRETLPNWITTWTVIDQRAILVADAARQLHRLDPETGKILWTYKAKGAIATGLSGAEQTLYLRVFPEGMGGQAFGPGDLYAIDIQTGQPRWQTSIALDQIEAKPVISGDQIYFPSTTFGPSPPGFLLMVGVLQAYNRQGQRLWRFDLPQLEQTGSEISPNKIVLVDQQQVYLSFKNQLYSVDRQHGDKRWGYNAGCRFWVWFRCLPDRILSVAIADQQAYLSTETTRQVIRRIAIQQD